MMLAPTNKFMSARTTVRSTITTGVISIKPLSVFPRHGFASAELGRGRRQVTAKAAAVAADPKMLCMQCEQTANQTGCTTIGNCGKTPEVAGLQDLLVHSLKGLGTLACHARSLGVTDAEVDSFCLRATFSTLTNVNFDDERFQEYIAQSLMLHNVLVRKLSAAGHPTLPAVPEVDWFNPLTGHPLQWNVRQASRIPDLYMPELLAEARLTGLMWRQDTLGKTVAGLQELCMYGLKGVAAYAAHAEALGGKDPQVYAAVQETLAFLGSPQAGDMGSLLGHALRLGEVNLVVMKLLSDSHIATFGKPEPTQVNLAPKPGKAILITGHDMHDLHSLLEQTEGKGINVYTHGEMLPAHGYPGLKKYKHLAGHYGGAWYGQKLDFANFPGSILATTNCILDPLSMYRKNLFTTGDTGLTNVAHVGSDYSPVIERALALPGWTEETALKPVKAHGVKAPVTVGFGHDAVLGVADKLIDAIHTGKLSHIFLVGGCDGHEPQRGYYSKLSHEMPTDTMLLTLGCGKFRLIDQDFGTLADTGLPRLVDMGQCNDAYSALVVATELAKALKTDINSLPLSLDISWFEQKAVAVLLTLLHLGVRNIRLGPILPAFLTPEVVDILVDKFALAPADVAHPEKDLMLMMANK